MLPGVAQAKLRAPALQSPTSGASVEALPTFSWAPVRHTAHYEFQLAADRKFASIMAGGGIKTNNTAATLEKAIPDGTYYWRVRAVSMADAAGRWSPTRTLNKAWTTPPILQNEDGLIVSWPVLPLVLHWSTVPHATTYQLAIATDDKLTNVVLGTASKPLETAGTQYALPIALSPGKYFWAVTPVDAQGHKGLRSSVSTFNWIWPTSTTPRVTDLDPDARVFDPQFSWDPVAGAAKYEVEINSAQDFPPNAKWCCSDRVIGTSVSPVTLLANNTYYWRVRAIDADDNAGQWNVGPSFEKSFDKVTPSVPALRMIDVNGATIDANPGAGTPAVTDTPIVAWDPVPGAARYEIQVGTFAGTWDAGGCSFIGPNTVDFYTSVPYWTPTAPQPQSIGPLAWPDAHTAQFLPAAGARYCVRVRARSADDTKNQPVISAAFTQLNDANHPAFQFDDPPAAPATPLTPALHATAGDYIAPASGSSNVRTPLFTWKRIGDADGYYVVVARDEDFTRIADVAYTKIPAYAPHNNASGTYPIPYSDETTAYYWAVIPYKASHTPRVDDDPLNQGFQSYNKLSDPPVPTGPVNGASIDRQPVFQWTRAEHAETYTLQVSPDPNFSSGSLIDDVETSSTAYTSSSTYPADSLLYWRVRANDVNDTHLRWSEEHPVVGTFRRLLDTPVPADDNPVGGQLIPKLSWLPVEGAVSYDLHVDQADGSTRDFTVRSTSFTPTFFYGTGIWRWRVRANFSASGGSVSGPYFAPQLYTRVLEAPQHVQGVKSRSRILLSWDADPAAKRYRAQISKTDAFGSTIENVTTDHTSWAPKLSAGAYRDGGRLYWRVGAIDAGRNTGAYATGFFVLPRGMRVGIAALLRSGKVGIARITVKNASNRPIRGARVTISGVGIRTIRRTTNRKGEVTVRVRPRRRGKLTVTVRRKGYADGLATSQVK
jgi:hypothetical protein